jgi:hypothetical protein
VRSVILYCPALGRDISALRAAIPGTIIIHEGQRMVGGHVQGWEASRQGHQAIVASAKADGADCVFVVEDDCEFTSHFNYDRWVADVQWAVVHGYDVLVGGSTRTYDNRLVRNGLIEVSAFHSSHCVVYLASGYDKVLRAGAPIDITIGRDEGARCLVALPFVAVQRPSFSGCEEHDVDYVPLYEQHEATLRTSLGITL